MKAVLINPHDQTVTDVDVDTSKGLPAFYKMIDCDLVEFFQLGGGIALVIDEEGMLKDQVSDPSGEDTVPQAFFRVMDTPLAGRAVLVKLDDDYNNASGFAEPGMDAAYIKYLFEHPSVEAFGWINPIEKNRLMRGQQEAVRAHYEAQGMNVEQCGEFGMVITEGGGK